MSALAPIATETCMNVVLINILAIWFALNIAAALAMYFKPLRGRRASQHLAEGFLRRSI